MSNTVIQLENAGARLCESCGQNASRMSWQAQNFDYQDGDLVVPLQARVPVWKCDECGDEYTDITAEELRHEAVCHYLVRLTPKEIKSIREQYKMSQAEWADTSRLGIASIKRWETGSLIQGASQDAYLRLLSSPANLATVREIGNQTTRGAFEFRNKLSADVRVAASVFRLRKYA